MRGCFVSGTDTGVGKTVLAAAIVAALRARGGRVAAFKPVVTGLDEAPAPGWPPDHELLAAVAGSAPERVSPWRFGPAVSPHLAAELARERLIPAELVLAARAAAATADQLIVEGVGGLLVPLTRDYCVRDFAGELGLPLVIAARPGLGTINHTLLTIEAARRAGLEPRAVVMTPWPAQPSAIERSNRDTVERLGGVEVVGLERVSRGDPALLARAGAALPLAEWVGAPGEATPRAQAQRRPAA
ncbi:MAG TPA: dethiobiotin synthase [Solirubrobacteraceae bacterium]|nr:dethiobiotin synthase [Solirubrobacteraceae bacterium]